MSGPGYDPALFDIAITWFCAGQNGAQESAPSPILTVAAGVTDTITVNISTLVAPNGTYRPSATSRIAVNPGIATAWYLYMGPTGQMLYRQAQVPLGQTSKGINLPLTGTVAAGTGQYPDLYFTLQNVLFRG